jgi:hypothetical protein
MLCARSGRYDEVGTLCGGRKRLGDDRVGGLLRELLLRARGLRGLFAMNGISDRAGRPPDVMLIDDRWPRADPPWLGAPDLMTVGAADDENGSIVPVAVVREPEADTVGTAEPDNRAGVVIMMNHAGAVNVDRIVNRDVDHFGLRRDDTDDLALHDDGLLRGGGEVAGGARGGAEALSGREDVGGLEGKDFAELARPSEILVHPLHNLGIAGQSLDAVVPRLGFHGLRVAAGLEIAGRHHHVRGKRGGGQDDRDEGIRIKGDRGEKLVELDGGEANLFG